MGEHPPIDPSLTGASVERTVETSGEQFGPFGVGLYVETEPGNLELVKHLGHAQKSMLESLIEPELEKLEMETGSHCSFVVHDCDGITTQEGHAVLQRVSYMNQRTGKREGQSYLMVRLPAWISWKPRPTAWNHFHIAKRSHIPDESIIRPPEIEHVEWGIGTSRQRLWPTEDES